METVLVLKVLSLMGIMVLVARYYKKEYTGK